MLVSAKQTTCTVLRLQAMTGRTEWPLALTCGARRLATARRPTGSGGPLALPNHDAVFLQGGTCVNVQM